MPLTVQVRMASNASRAQFVAELAQLHRLQLKSVAAATFVGWTHEQEVAHWERSDRISVLQRELDALGDFGIVTVARLLKTRHPLASIAVALSRLASDSCGYRLAFSFWQVRVNDGQTRPSHHWPICGHPSQIVRSLWQ